MNKIYYSQVDSRWANHPYPSPELPHATIASGGCGACSCAMAVSMLKEIVDPITMADMFVKDGIRVNGGTSSKAYPYIAEKYGLKAEKTADYNKVIECLKGNGIVIVGCGSGLFTSGAHIICIHGIRDNNFLIYDSYLYKDKFNTSSRKGKVTLEGTTVVCPIDNFKAYANAGNFWCYEGTGIDTNKGEIEEKNDRGTVGQTKKFAKNVNLYSNEDLTGTRYSYLKNTTVTILENVSDRVDKIYVPATKRTAYVDISAYTDEVVSTVKLMIVTAKSGLNVRKEPTTKSGIVTAYAYKTKVEVYSIENGWAKGEKGYMYAEYLK